MGYDVIIIVDCNVVNSTLPKHIMSDYRNNKEKLKIAISKDTATKLPTGGYLIFKFYDAGVVPISSEDGFLVPKEAITGTIGQWR